MWKIILLSCFSVHCALAALSCQPTNAKASLIPVSLVSQDTNNYYVDFGSDSTQKSLYRYDSITGKTYSASVNGPSLGPASFIVPAAGSPDRFVVGFKFGVFLVCWDGISSKADVQEELVNLISRFGPKERVGFGHRDPSGRTLYVATLDTRFCGPPANQSVYKRQSGQGLEQLVANRVLTDQKVPNGWAFIKDKLYILDSCTLKIYEIPFTKCKGAIIGQERVIFDFHSLGKESGHFFPNGLEGDLDGNLYTVSYYCGSVISISTITGKAKVIAKAPTGGTTSVSLLGKDLYITVAQIIIDVLTGRAISTQKLKTSLYVIRNLAQGPPFNPYKA